MNRAWAAAIRVASARCPTAGPCFSAAPIRIKRKWLLPTLNVARYAAME
jgi:hypothetical protein